MTMLLYYNISSFSLAQVCLTHKCHTTKSTISTIGKKRIEKSTTKTRQLSATKRYSTVTVKPGRETEKQCQSLGSPK